MRARYLPAAGIAVLVVLAGCGNDSSTSGGAAQRVVEVTMTDNTYSPASFAFAAGESVTFRFRNEVRRFMRP